MKNTTIANVGQDSLPKVDIDTLTSRQNVSLNFPQENIKSLFFIVIGYQVAILTTKSM